MTFRDSFESGDILAMLRLLPRTISGYGKGYYKNLYDLALVSSVKVVVVFRVSTVCLALISVKSRLTFNFSSCLCFKVT